MLLGTAVWAEGGGLRQALVARLASGRIADLSRIEGIRLRKLGEADPDRLAAVLVPASLRQVLEGGPRALARVRQTVAYAEKWDRRGTLPDSLAPASGVMGPCLPRPALLRRFDGTQFDRFSLRGPDGEVGSVPLPTLAAIGLAGGGVAGFCLALEEGSGPLLGAWISDAWPEGSLEFRVGAARRTVPIRAWEGLDLPPLRAGEAMLLPPPRLRPFPSLAAGTLLQLGAAFDQLTARLGPEGLHPTVQ